MNINYNLFINQIKLLVDDNEIYKLVDKSLNESKIGIFS